MSSIPTDTPNAAVINATREQITAAVATAADALEAKRAELAPLQAELDHLTAILAAIDRQPAPRRGRPPRSSTAPVGRPPASSGPSNRDKVVAVLGPEPLSLDDLASRSDLTPAQVRSVLNNLKRNGAANREDDGRWTAA